MGETPAKSKPLKSLGSFRVRNRKIHRNDLWFEWKQVCLSYEDATNCLVSVSRSDPGALKSKDPWKSMPSWSKSKAWIWIGNHTRGRRSQGLWPDEGILSDPRGLVRIVIVLLSRRSRCPIALTQSGHEADHEIGVLLSIKEEQRPRFLDSSSEVVRHLTSTDRRFPRADGQPSFLRAVCQLDRSTDLNYSTKSPRPFLGIAYASLLCLILLSLSVTTQHSLAQEPKENINKNELRRNEHPL